MMIQYCPRCSGRPYTKALDVAVCPNCGTALELENVSEAALAGRAELSGAFRSTPVGFGGGSGSFGGNDAGNGNGGLFGVPDPMAKPAADVRPQPPAWGTPQGEKPAPHNPNPVVQPQQDGPITILPAGGHTHATNRSVEAALGTTIRGRILKYSSSGMEDGHYRRPLVLRIWQAIVYGQRFEDVLHRFTVRVQGGTDAFGQREHFDVPVNVHGTISGGVQLADDNEVEVTGTYKKGGVLMARKISVLSNGYKTDVQFQRSIGLMVIAFFALIAAIGAVYILADASNGGTIWPGIAGFLKTWLTIAAILLVLYILFCFSRFGFRLMMIFGRGRGSPILTIVLLSLILTVLFTARFGTAANLLNTLLSLGSALLPSVLVLVLMLYLLFRLIFPKR